MPLKTANPKSKRSAPAASAGKKMRASGLPEPRLSGPGRTRPAASATSSRRVSVSSRSAPLKKRIAASERSPVKRKPAAAQSAPALKRPAVVDSGTAHDSIVAGLPGIEELTPEERELFGALIARSLGLAGMCAVEAEVPWDTAAEKAHGALSSVEGKLKMELQEAQMKADDAYKRVVVEHETVEDVEAKLTDLRSMIAKSKMDMRASTKAIETFQHGLKVVRTGQTASESKIDAAAGRVEQLCNVDEKLYQPLKEAVAKGSKGQRQLKSIQQVGKELGFQRTLLAAIPTVLKKDLAKRRTVDGLVMDEFDSELARHYDKFGAALKDEQARFAELTAAAREAHVCLKDSKQALSSHGQVFAKAEAALPQTRMALTAARQNARRLESELQKAIRDLSCLEARLAAFHAGPLAAFQALRQGRATLESDSAASLCAPTVLQASLFAPTVLQATPESGSAASMCAPTLLNADAEAEASVSDAAARGSAAFEAVHQEQAIAKSSAAASTWTCAPAVPRADAAREAAVADGQVPAADPDAWMTPWTGWRFDFSSASTLSFLDAAGS